MITAETMINYGSYTISRYTYSADVSATGKELTMYEVYDNSVNDLIEAFDTLDEAIEHTENEIMWEWCLTDSFPAEAQEEHKNLKQISQKPLTNGRKNAKIISDSQFY